MGAKFGWLLAILALAIGLVANLLYAIAKDAKEQVATVQKTLDATLKEAKSSLGWALLHTDIAKLIDELGMGTCWAERMRLLYIRDVISIGERLLKPMSNVIELMEKLKKKIIPLSVEIDKPFDPRFNQFLRYDLAPYLEGLHERLCVSHISESEKTHTHACMLQFRFICVRFRAILLHTPYNFELRIATSMQIPGAAICGLPLDINTTTLMLANLDTVTAVTAFFCIKRVGWLPFS